ncbi:MAG: gas vesicle structural protein GvpA [Actinobacteria bacterium]|nr:MAG: gas vesicle structural protein GvpA [Actinomycetota bacterium]
MAMQPATSGSNVERPGAGTLSDVITTILDKGLVIDVYARVSLVGIELLRADVRVVVASVDTYLRFAEAVNRLELSTSEPAGLPDLVEGIEEGGSKKKTKGALDAASEKLGEVLDTGDDEEEEEAVESRPRRRREKGRTSS